MILGYIRNQGQRITKIYTLQVLLFISQISREFIILAGSLYIEHEIVKVLIYSMYVL